MTASVLALGLGGCVALNDAFDADESMGDSAGASASDTTPTSGSAESSGSTRGASGDGSAGTASDPTTQSSTENETAVESKGDVTTSGGDPITSGTGSSSSGDELDAGDPTRPVEPVKMLWVTAENVPGDFGDDGYLTEAVELCEIALEDTIADADCNGTDPVALLASDSHALIGLPDAVPAASFLLSPGPFEAAANGNEILGSWESILAGEADPAFVPNLLVPFGGGLNPVLRFWTGSPTTQSFGQSCSDWSNPELDGLYVQINSIEQVDQISTSCTEEFRLLCACLGTPADAE